MKILLIDVYHFNKGGAETVCFNTGKMLEENGHEVIYFTLKWNKNLPSPFEKYFPESKETRKGLFRQIINLRNYFYYPDAAKKLEQLILDEKPVNPAKRKATPIKNEKRFSEQKRKAMKIIKAIPEIVSPLLLHC